MSLCMDEASEPTELRELVVCVRPGEKHLFQYMRSPSFVFRPLQDPGPDGPDFVVFQAGQNLDFASTVDALPPGLWRRVREGRGKVVIDASPEGEPHRPEVSEALRGMLQRVGAPLRQAVYVTQHRGYAGEYADYCRRLGLPQAMKVVTYDYWLRRSLANYEETGAEVFATRRASFLSRERTRERRFLSLNFTPRPERVLFLLSLMREGLWEQGFVSFGGFVKGERLRSPGRSRKKLLGLEGFETEAASLEPLILELRRRGQLLLGHPEVMQRPDALPEYDRSWFSVVTETEMMSKPCRITEKPLKPLLNFHPFVVFGNPGALGLIRELGFQTFPEVFDESYDDELGPPRRFEMAFAQVRRLCGLEERELERLDAAVSEKLEFNAEWGLTKLPHIYRTQIDRALLKDLLSP